VKTACRGSIEFLETDWSPERALFSFSARRTPDGVVRDYEHPQALRYTINTLLGLSQAAASGWDDVFVQRAPRLVDAFLERRYEAVELPADVGLLLVLAAETGRCALADALVDRVRSLLGTTPASSLNMQDLGWMLWGATAAARTSRPGADDAADALFRLVDGSFVDPRTSLPRHSVRRYRRNVVSFGSLVYFLRAMGEYARLSGVRRARELFHAGVETALRLQGPLGEWPWLIDIERGAVIDRYPVFTVHQDGMAFLFLHPAADEGIDVEAATRRSLEWVAGGNELATPMLEQRPFWGHRSIARRERWQRARRYARSRVGAPGDAPAPLGRLHVNDECRSYHLGWLLYAWSGRDGLDVLASSTPALAGARV
jgi:hypothetical protein